MLEAANLPKKQLRALKAYIVPNPRLCAVQITGLFRSQLLYTSGFELHCRYQPRIAENIVTHEAAHLRMHDNFLIGMLIVASCAVATNQLFFGYYSNPNQFGGLVLLIVFFTYAFRRREYTADALAVNSLPSKVGYVTALFRSNLHTSSFGHPSAQSRIVALYAGSPVLSIRWQVVGIGLLVLFFYWQQPRSDGTESAVVAEFFGRLAFSILPFLVVTRELLKGPRRKLPAVKSDCVDEIRSPIKSPRGCVISRDWYRELARDCAGTIQALKEAGEEDEAEATGRKIRALLEQLNPSKEETLSEGETPNTMQQPVHVIGGTSRFRNRRSPRVLANKGEMLVGYVAARSKMKLAISIVAAVILACGFNLAVLFGGGPRPIKSWPNVFGGFGSAPDLRIRGFQGQDAILEVGFWPRDGRMIYSLLRPVRTLSLKDGFELIATSGSGKYSAFLDGAAGLQFGSRGERMELGKSVGPETVVIKANDTDSVVYRRTVNDPIITVGFSPDDSFPALALWKAGYSSSEIDVVSLRNEPTRSSRCLVRGQVVESVRIQKGGESFTGIGYSAKYELDEDYSGFVPTRAQLLSTVDCGVIGHADFASIYQAFDWTADGKTIAFSPPTEHDSIQVHNLETGLTHVIGTGFIEGVALSPDGGYVMAGIMDWPQSAFHASTLDTMRHFIKLWSVQTGTLRTTVRVSNTPHAMAVSPDGKTLWTTICSDQGDNHVSCDVRVWVSSAWRISWLPWNKGQIQMQEPSLHGSRDWKGSRSGSNDNGAALVIPNSSGIDRE
jgi:hypothetical protein